MTNDTTLTNEQIAARTLALRRSKELPAAYGLPLDECGAVLGERTRLGLPELAQRLEQIAQLYEEAKLCHDAQVVNALRAARWACMVIHDDGGRYTRGALRRQMARIAFSLLPGRFTSELEGVSA